MKDGIRAFCTSLTPLVFSGCSFWRFSRPLQGVSLFYLHLNTQACRDCEKILRNEILLFLLILKRGFYIISGKHFSPSFWSIMQRNKKKFSRFLFICAISSDHVFRHLQSCLALPVCLVNWSGVVWPSRVYCGSIWPKGIVVDRLVSAAANGKSVRERMLKLVKKKRMQLILKPLQS